MLDPQEGEKEPKPENPEIEKPEIEKPEKDEEGGPVIQGTPPKDPITPDPTKP